MAVTALPDLNVLPAEQLRALILAQHEQLFPRDKLTTTKSTALARARDRASEVAAWSSCTACSLGGSRRNSSGRSSSWSCDWRNWNPTAARESPHRPNPLRFQLGSTASAAKPARRALPDHLPRQTRRHEPKETVCPQCQGELRKLGEDVSEMLEYVPASFVVIRHVRTKLSCTKCDCIVQAEAPSRPIERGLAGPGLLAHVLVSKYCDHQPLYRQSEIYARQGVELERARRWPTG